MGRVKGPLQGSSVGAWERENHQQKHGKMNILKNAAKKNTDFFNLPRPEKSASRVGEKQILRKFSQRKQSFSENCNFRKSSSRPGESSILKKKIVKLQKSSELRGGPFLMNVSANMKIFVKIT